MRFHWVFPVIGLIGVAFVDIDHHYARKQADNNLELHPVFDIHF